MGDLLHRMTDSVLGSEMLPARLRMRLMRALGYDIDKDACIWAKGCFRSKNLSIGPGVFINVGFFFDGYDRLEIGRNVRFGQYVRVITATHEIGPPQQRGLIEVVGAPVTIGDGCWIGINATILPGVTIAPGCVIAAGAVVVKSTAPNGLYAGVPARRLRDLPVPAAMPPAPPASQTAQLTALEC